MVVSTHLKNISQRIVSLGRGEHLKSWNHHLAVYSWSIPNLPTSLRIESCSFHGLLLPLANSLSILSSTWTFLCHARHKGVSDTASRFCFLPDSCPILSTGPWRTMWRIVFAPTNSWTPKTTLISSPPLLISQYWDSHTGSTIVLSLPLNSTGNRILYLYVNSITTSFSWLTWIVHIGIKPSPLKTVMSHPILCLWKRDAWVK